MEDWLAYQLRTQNISDSDIGLERRDTLNEGFHCFTQSFQANS
jgi:hypothetical protein